MLARIPPSSPLALAAYVGAARSAAAAGLRERAEALLERAKRLPGGAELASAERAAFLIRAGRAEEAVAILRADGRPPASPATRRLLALALAASGAPAESLKLLPGLAKSLPQARLEALRRRLAEALLAGAAERNELSRAWDGLPAAARNDPAVLRAYTRRLLALGAGSEAARLIESRLQATGTRCSPRSMRRSPMCPLERRLRLAEAWHAEHPSAAPAARLGPPLPRGLTLGQERGLSSASHRRRRGSGCLDRRSPSCTSAWRTGKGPSTASATPSSCSAMGRISRPSPASGGRPPRLPTSSAPPSACRRFPLNRAERASCREHGRLAATRSLPWMRGPSAAEAAWAELATDGCCGRASDLAARLRHPRLGRAPPRRVRDRGSRAPRGEPRLRPRQADASPKTPGPAPRTPFARAPTGVRARSAASITAPGASTARRRQRVSSSRTLPGQWVSGERGQGLGAEALGFEAELAGRREPADGRPVAAGHRGRSRSGGEVNAHHRQAMQQVGAEAAFRHQAVECLGARPRSDARRP